VLTVEELLARQSEEMQGLTAERVAAVLRLYRETRADLLQRLEILEDTGRGDRFTAQHYRNALLQIEAGIETMDGRMTGQLVDGLGIANRMAGSHLAQQVAAGQKQWRGTVRPLPTSVAVAMREGETLLLPQFKSSVDRYGNELIRGMQQRMAISLQAQESLFETRNRIFKDYLQPLRTVKMGREMVPPTAYFAERIVRTELVSSYNVTFNAHLDQAAAQDPKLRRRWSSALSERRTCPVCRQMHDQTVDTGEPFKVPGGGTVMTPPVHPNCACACVAWKDVWDKAAVPTPEFHDGRPPPGAAQPFWKMEPGDAVPVRDGGGLASAPPETIKVAKQLANQGNEVFLRPEPGGRRSHDAAVNPPRGNVDLNRVELTGIEKRDADHQTVKNRIEDKHRRNQGADQLVIGAPTSDLTREDAITGVARAWDNIRGEFSAIRIMGKSFDLTFWKKPTRI
jgi:hypothetical protein